MGVKLCVTNLYTIFLFFCFQQSNMTIPCTKQHSKNSYQNNKRTIWYKDFSEQQAVFPAIQDNYQKDHSRNL